MAKHVALTVSKSAADVGYEYSDGTELHLRLCLVDEDGTVRAWDEVGEIYSVHHDLTDAQQEEARRLARRTIPNSHAQPPRRRT